MARASASLPPGRNRGSPAPSPPQPAAAPASRPRASSALPPPAPFSSHAGPVSPRPPPARPSRGGHPSPPAGSVPLGCACTGAPTTIAPVVRGYAVEGWWAAAHPRRVRLGAHLAQQALRAVPLVRLSRRSRRAWCTLWESLHCRDCIADAMCVLYRERRRTRARGRRACFQVSSMTTSLGSPMPIIRCATFFRMCNGTYSCQCRQLR